MEIPDSIDKHVDILIPGIESEEVEEINDAYKDILEELGNWKNPALKENQKQGETEMPAQPAFEAYAIDLINLYRHSFHQGVLEGERNLTAEQDKCRIMSCMMFEPRLGQRQYNKDPTIKARLTYKFTSVPGLVAASCCTFLDLDQLDINELNVWFHFGIQIQQALSPNQLI